MRRSATLIALFVIASVAMSWLSESGAVAQTRIAPQRIAPPPVTAPPRIAPAPRPIVTPRPVVPIQPHTRPPGGAQPAPEAHREPERRPSVQGRMAPVSERPAPPTRTGRSLAEPPGPGFRPPLRPGSFAAPIPTAAGFLDPDAFADGEVLVTVQDGFGQADVEAIAAVNNLTIVETAQIDLIGAQVLRLSVDDARSVDEVVATLDNDPRIAYAGRNRIFRSQSQSTRADAQYALTRLKIPAAHEIATGKGVTIAVIDTAADLDHPALAEASVKSQALRDDATPADHATQIIGLITAGGLLLGAAPAAEILSLPAFVQDDEGHGSSSTTMILMRALDHSDRAGARVVNMSFAGGEDPLLANALDVMETRGRVMVAAAGNGGPGAAPAFPASHGAVVAVTAIDAADGLYAMANRGDYIELAAPGVDLLAPALRGSYSLATGTSHATAYVSAAAALMLEIHPGATAGQIRAALAASAVDLGPTGPDPQFGAGRIAPVAGLRLIGEARSVPAVSAASDSTHEVTGSAISDRLP